MKGLAESPGAITINCEASFNPSGPDSSQWVTGRLSDVAQVERIGVDPAILSDERYVGLEHISGDSGDLRWQYSREAELRSTKFRFSSRHLLYGKLRPNLKKIARPGFEGVCSTDILPIRPRDGVMDRDYLFHFLRQPQMIELAVSQTSGVNLPRLSPSLLSDFPISYPRDIAEQKRIAVILDKADAIRRKRQQAIQLADEFLRSVFLDMFGDPATNPKAWRRVIISEIGKVITGNTPPREQKRYYGNHIEWIKTDNISAAKYFLTKATEGLSESGLGVGRSVPAGSTLITCIAGSPSSIGNSAYADRSVAFNQQINAIMPYQEFPSLFVFGLVRASKRLIQERSTAAMKGMVSKSSLESVEVYDPPESLKARYASIFTKALADIDRQITAETQADILFKAVSQRAFAGML
ncbi:restriction endonuclease subunit S [Thiorhodococcus minor]|uniref:Restriction endonuclease subunit S n=1 Tax=Thiorhodococcus minor TaxID=57489 RepID=A0A6M0JS75_9GAMM|nr:restriction endonuclease subunit S [Thiorhodococcus minor]NEV60370.1 restriction endonuclease subunit S [Thiorhodococcus minor]